MLVGATGDDPRDSVIQRAMVSLTHQQLNNGMAAWMDMQRRERQGRAHRVLAYVLSGRCATDPEPVLKPGPCQIKEGRIKRR